MSERGVFNFTGSVNNIILSQKYAKYNSAHTRKELLKVHEAYQSIR